MRASVRRAALGIVLGSLILTPALRGTTTIGNRQQPQDQKEIHDFVLTEAFLDKLAATRKAFERLPREQRDAGASKVGSIDGFLQAIQKSPQALTAVRSNGLTPREFFVGGIALGRTEQLVGAKQVGSASPAASMLADAARNYVSPANEAFVEKHWDEITKMFGGAPRKP